MDLVAWIFTDGNNLEAHLNSLKSRFEHAASFSPSLINSHIGKDYFSFEDNLTLFTKAIEWGACSDHPIKGKVLKNKLSPERRYIEDWEIDEALTVAPPLIASYVRLKLLTALRMSDMLSLRWQDIQEDGIHVNTRKITHSTDDTEAAVQRFIDLEPNRFRYVFERQQGKSFALNRGLLLARGDKLLLTDDDVVIVPHWNAIADDYRSLARLLQKMGHTVAVISLPFHDARGRNDPEAPELDSTRMVTADIGLTLRCMRQAVQDILRLNDWLAVQGKASLAVLGTSIR